MANYYTTVDRVAAQHGLSAEQVPSWMLDTADALIERYTGQAYDGASHSVTLNSVGGPVLEYPFGPVASGTVTVSGTPVDTAAYRLTDDGLYREDGENWPYGRANVAVAWTASSSPPDIWGHVATLLAGQLAMWAMKYGGSNLTRKLTQQGGSGAGATEAVTEFPPDLSSELDRILTVHLGARQWRGLRPPDRRFNPLAAVW